MNAPHHTSRMVCLGLILSLLHPVSAQETEPDPALDPAMNLDPGTLDTTIVTGKAEDLLGVASAATKGQANNEELSQRPILRRGELLEVVPGVVITQHSGGGKANQYFVRGFNLDHGTDFRITLDGMPVNFRTHAHGQGYADLSFLVPEFVEGLDYFKGPFYPALGDLSTAGGAQYRLFQELPTGIASLTWGEHEYYRALLADSFQVGHGILTLGGEFTHENGPWERESDFRRFNGLVRYHAGDEDNFVNLTAMGYDGKWNSTDQIPKRALDAGLIDRFEGIDDTDGGDSSRYSLQASARVTGDRSVTHVDSWLGFYDLDLYSNFTYFLNDPVRGDQFEQVESRWFAGLDSWHRMEHTLFGRESTTTIGFQMQHDWINDIGLHLTESRRRYDTVREDDVYEGSYGLYAANETRLTDWLRFGLGARADLFHFDVDSHLAGNSGSETDGIVSPKAHLVFGPWNETEIYLNAGLGFHSNDARGVTISRDPLTGEPVDSVDPLVRTKGAELGVRTQLIPDVTATIGLWWLESDSELVFVGDAGTTEAGPASERYGIEAAIYWRPRDWISIDAEYAWSHARFKGVPGDDEIPNAIEHMASGGIHVGRDTGFYASLRARFFSGYPLEESGTFHADDSFLVNARAGYRWDDWELAVDMLNVFDRDDNDIAYYYESRLRGEPAAGIADVHLHPVEPRQFRVSLTCRW